MIKLFTNKTILNDILETEAPKNIYSILMSGHISSIHLPEGDPGEDISSMGIVDDLISDLGQTGTTICWEDNTTNDVFTHYDFVTNCPNAIYILDIEPEKADFITKKYGVLCISNRNLKDEVLTKSYEFYLEQDEDNVSWETFMNCGANSIPSNYLVISDRYIFSSSEKAGRKEALDAVDLGLINIKCILNNLLPKSLHIPYKVVIIFDSSTIKCNDPTEISFENKVLNYIKQELSNFGKRSHARRYEIIFYLVSVDHNSMNYTKLHNRKIVSTYFLIRSEHKIRAFNGSVSEATQTLSFDAIFSKIENKQKNGPHSPIVCVEQTLRCLKELADSGNCRYFYNTSSLDKNLKDCTKERFLFF